MADAEKLVQEELIFDIEKDPYNYAMRVVFCRWKPFILRAMHSDEGELTHFSRFTKQYRQTPRIVGTIFRGLMPQEPKPMVSSTPKVVALPAFAPGRKHSAVQKRPTRPIFRKVAA